MEDRLSHMTKGLYFGIHLIVTLKIIENSEVFRMGDNLPNSEQLTDSQNVLAQLT